MAAVANLPFYSTSYGESHGYNERDGTNPSTFRNRYLNHGYRGTAELGPVRFAATRAQAETDLPHVNAVRPQTAALQRTQQLAQTQQQNIAFQRPASASSYTRGSALQQTQQQQQEPSYALEAAQAASQRRSWELEANRSTRYEQQVQAQRQGREERFDEGGYSQYEQQPRGVYSSSPARSQQFQQQEEYAPQQSLQQARLAQSQQFGSSIGARYALPNPAAQPSVNASPYYVPPYEQPPTSSFAPAARALGNKTYRFETDDESSYPFAQSFRGQPHLNRNNKPEQDPGQSIPYGRLQAEDAKDVRHSMAMSSWDSFHVANRDGTVNYNLEGIATKRKQKIDPESYCKWSISKRLPKEQMRYALPGYCGFIPTAQLRHGSTYGKTTRAALLGSPQGL